MKHYILDALKQYNEAGSCSYHMPGHKKGLHFPQILKDAWGDTFATYDATEIPGLDNLHDAKECIMQSQEQAAKIYGAKSCHYLVNGTSGGLIAAILANCYRQKVFVPRHCHTSILHGLILAQADIIYLPIVLDPASQLPLGVSYDTLKHALEEHPDCHVLIMVNPTYQGITWQNEHCLSLALARNLTVLVDEAHGAHLHFHPQLPASLLDKGAHLVVQSWHKMLPTLTQTSALLTHSTYNGCDLAPYLAMTETSSPSYPFLCALEACSVEMHQHGYAQIDASLTQIHALHAYVQQLKTLQILTDSSWKQDPFKIYLISTVLSGTLLAEKLMHQFSLFVEMSDSNGCLLLLPLNFTADARQALCDILLQIDQSCFHLPLREITPAFYTQTIPQQALSLHEAFFCEKIMLPLKDCAGKIAGEFIKLYPPGIPLVMMGERISQEAITLWQANGGSLDDKIAIIPER